MVTYVEANQQNVYQLEFETRIRVNGIQDFFDDTLSVGLSETFDRNRESMSTIEIIGRHRTERRAYV